MPTNTAQPTHPLHRNHCQSAEEILRARREPIAVSVHRDGLSLRVGADRYTLTVEQAHDLATRLVECAEVYARNQRTRDLEVARSERELRVVR